MTLQPYTTRNAVSSVLLIVQHEGHRFLCCYKWIVNYLNEKRFNMKELRRELQKAKEPMGFCLASLEPQYCLKAQVTVFIFFCFLLLALS